jgi:hypothetical protein
MDRVTALSLLSLIAPLALAAQQPAAPHDSVQGAVRTVDVRARMVEVTTGVGFALRIVRMQVPAEVPITNRAARGGQPAPLKLAELKPGDVIRAQFGARPTGFVAYTIERVGRMDAAGGGPESKP